MHEFSLIEGLLKRVGEVAAEREAAKVKKVRLRVGPLSGAEPHLLKEAFRLLGRGGIAEGAELEIKIPELHLTCGRCGAAPNRGYTTFVCQECGEALPIDEGSSDLVIESLEMEVEGDV